MNKNGGQTMKDFNLEVGQRVVVDGVMGRVTRMGFQGGPDTYNQVATIVLDGDFSYEDRCRIVKEQRKL